MNYICNFNISRDFSEIEFFYKEYKKTNLDFLLEDFLSGSTEWSCPKNTQCGDNVIFMCAKTARNNLGMATSHIPSDSSQDFQDFVDQQKALYKKYSGHLLGFGVVDSTPVFDAEDNRWYAVINQLQRFPVPLSLDEFKSFITINSRSSITVLSDDQWDRIKWLIDQRNPGTFQNTTPPDVDTLDQEFEKAVQIEAARPLDQLKKKAQKESALSPDPPEYSIVKTKTFHRNPAIAAFVKKRAAGRCQLCEKNAPFIDPNGEPYLECHHIKWLSSGGKDSVENCVALCPDCHRKMHILKDPDDISKLMAKVK